MGGQRGRGGGGGASSPSMFCRNLRRDLESAMKKCNIQRDVDQLVNHLRSTNPLYGRLKQQPLTKSVRQILLASGKGDDDISDVSNGQERNGKKRKRLGESEEKSGASSSVDSSDDDDQAATSIDLMKSMMRENYCRWKKKRDKKTVNWVHENRWPMFKDLGGMRKVIDDLTMRVLLPLCHPELGGRPPAGILLHGPPGCGKTMLAHAIGAPEDNIREVFSKAYRTTPCIVFIDEIDVIASKRENSKREMDLRIITQLMTSMGESYRLVKPTHRNEDSDNKSCHVLVIGTTNRLDVIDPALRRPGRFDLEIGLDLPDEEARSQILTVLTHNEKVGGPLDLKEVARSTPGFVGTDLNALVQEAANLAVRRNVNQRNDVLLSKYGEAWWKPSTQICSPEEITKLGITMNDFEEAAKVVQPSSTREGFSNLPNVKWDDVGGLHSIKRELDRYIVKPIKYPQYYKVLGNRFKTGFLLYGPPGCGKTLIAQAVVKETGANFIHIKGPELLNKYVGESEATVRKMFSRARACSPCIIFFDELDALTTDRGRERGHVVEGVLTQLLVELDGGEQRRGVYVIGATNRPDIIDKALLRPGRFGKLLYVPLPSPKQRGMILRALVGDLRIDDTVDLMAIGKSSSCENFSGADLSNLMNQAAVFAVDNIQAESLADDLTWTIRNEDFEKAFEEISPSVSKEQLQFYRSFSNISKSSCE
ncbi:cell division control protein 48 homolog C-like isoform X2 [Henckelia pumila]|uniref:cell division control protein 48 homolog C-like isoform X2 n=1 Tax=Henckelia pumila TaxID=405737 RepID=UPI003C6DEAD4